MNRDKSLSITKLDSFSSHKMNLLEEEVTNSALDFMLSQGDSLRKKSFTGLLRKLSVVKLNGINIKPSHIRPPILNLRQQFLFPANFGQNKIQPVEKFTQTYCDSSDIQIFSSVSRSSLSNNVIKFHYNGFDDCSNPIKSISIDRKPVEQRPSFTIQRPRPCSKSSRSRPMKRLKTENVEEMASDDHHSQVLNLCDIPSYLEQAVDSLQDSFWESNLQGLKILLEILHLVDWTEYEKFLPIIGRRLVDLIRSPRSVLVRVTCQTAGELFRASRCFKRPEFEELVLLLLQKTGDPNKFIRKDANVALDKMVTFVPFSHSVRTLSMEGPQHKSALVRIATARLFVCVCALVSLDLVLGTESNARTRRRIICALQMFLRDKNTETRHYGERLYKMLSKHKFFNDYFFKDMEMNTKLEFKRLFQTIDQKQF